MLVLNSKREKKRIALKDSKNKSKIPPNKAREILSESPNFDIHYKISTYLIIHELQSQSGLANTTTAHHDDFV